jgi:hypothetical protein
MHDLFTEEDRQRVNAAMAAGSSALYERKLAEQPAPSAARSWLTRIGLAVVGLVIAVFVLAIAGAPLVVAGPIMIAIVVLALGLGGRLAQRMHERSLRASARSDAVGGYAAERGWAMVDAIALPATTPLLREGDRRKTGWGVHGALPDGSRFVAGHYQYEVERESRDADGNTTTRWDRYPFAVAIVDAPLPDLHTLQLTRGSTGGILSKLSGAVSDLRPVPLESEEFNRAFRLMVADAAEEQAVRLRFTPAVQVALVERGAGESRAEAENGVLLVARAGEPKHEDFGELVDVLGDALWLRALLTDDPPGRVPELAPLRALLLGEEGRPGGA